MHQKRMMPFPFFPLFALLAFVLLIGIGSFLKIILFVGLLGVFFKTCFFRREMMHRHFGHGHGGPFNHPAKRKHDQRWPYDDDTQPDDESTSYV